MKKRILSLLIVLLLLLSLMPATVFAATEISRIRIQGLDYPEPNKPVSLYTAYTSSDEGISFYAVDWFDATADRFLEEGDVFLPEHEYELQIWVMADDGYAFKCANDYTPSVTATIDGYSMEVSKAFEYKAFAMVVLTYRFSYLPQKEWIKSVDLTVPAPVTGEKPSYTQISTTRFDTKNVSFSGATNPNMVNGIAWYKTSTGEGLNPSSGVFEANTIYNFHCLVFPREGYRIAPNATVKVNGKKASAHLDYDHFLTVSYDFPETGASAAHTHTYSQWRYNAGEHYKLCTICNEMFFTEDHKGGTATCQEDGTCTVCGYAYLKADENLHVPDTGKWVARGDMYHFHKCSICGAHCDIEDHRWSPKYHPVDASGHAYICADCKGHSEILPHISGPAGTPGAAEVCKDCGYIITPEKDHTHKLTLVPEVAPTCTDPGTKAYYTCSGCSDRFGDDQAKEVLPSEEDLIIPPLGHQISDQWTYNQETHWRLCTVCGEKMVETDMVHDLQDNQCSTCQYGKEKPAETEPEETKPEETGSEETKSKPSQNHSVSDDAPKGPQWWVILLVGIGTIALGIGTGVLLIQSKKKKESKK